VDSSRSEPAFIATFSNHYIISRSDKPLYLELLNLIANEDTAPRSIVSALIRELLQELAAQDEPPSSSISALLVTLNQRHLDIYEAIVKSLLGSIADASGRQNLESKFFNLINVSHFWCLYSSAHRTMADRDLRLISEMLF
jgi:hypothetical protein